MSMALNRMLPTPACRAIISLVTIVISASTTPVRAPIRISGRAAGRTTRTRRDHQPIPIAAADHSIFSSTARAPW
jgi:hypothetical protein